MTIRRPVIERAVPLIDIEIERGGDGRTVTAYAATFDSPYEVMDFEGHYDELISRAAFDRTLGRGLGAIQVLFNHGRTVWGTPSERFSMPLGTPIEVRAEPKGLLTRTTYAKTELGDEVLELIRSGSIRGQSFRGPIFASKKRGMGANGRPVIERMELGLKEYGPSPFPTNAGAEILALRSQMILDQARDLSPEERAELIAALSDEDPQEEPGTNDGATSPDPSESSPTEEQPAPPDGEAPAAGPSVDLLALEQEQRRRRTAVG